MRKLLKVFFSQTIIVILLLLIQVGVILFIMAKLQEYSKLIGVLFILLTVVAVVLLINTDKNPAYKMSWLIPMMVFPLFGGMLYLVVQGQGLTRRFFQRAKKIDRSLLSTIPENSDIMEEIRRDYPYRYSSVSYSSRNPGVGYRVFKNTAVKYYPVGELCWKDMLEELEKAEKYIFLEYFIIERGVMWDSILDILKRKAAQGVDIRVMYDGVGSLVQMPRRYPRELKRYGIKCKAFLPLVPFLSTVQNNRDHRKIMVIDGKVAFNGGINLADEYVNEKNVLGHWKDTAVRLTGDAAYSFTLIFLQLWQLTERWRVDLYRLMPPVNTGVCGDGYVMPYADTPNDDYQVGEFIYLDVINKARSYIHITTPYLILDNEMMTALVNAARSGVDVKIIIPSRADHWYAFYVALDYARELISKGIEVYEYSPGFIHAKNFVSDGELAVVGSINLDYRSLFLHFECATWMLGSGAVADVEEDFSETLKSCRMLTEDILKARPLWKRLVSAVLRMFAPLM